MANSYTSLFTHVIFSTHNREPLLKSALRERLFAYMGGIARANKIKAVSIGGVEEYLSFLKEYNVEYDERYVWR